MPIHIDAQLRFGGTNMRDQMDYHSDNGSEDVSAIVAGRSARETLEALLGYYSSQVAATLDEDTYRPERQSRRTTPSTAPQF